MAATGKLQTISDTYTTSELSVTIGAKGYLDITLAKSDDSAFSSSDIEEFLEAADIRLDISVKVGGVDELEAAVARINNDLSGGKVVFTEKDAAWYPVLNSAINQGAGTRLRAVLPVKAGARIYASCGLGVGVAAAIYDTLDKCIPATTDYIQELRFSYDTTVEGVALYDGYLCVLEAKTDYNKAFTPADLRNFQLNTKITVTMSSEGRERKDLFIGTLVNKTITATGMGSDSTVRASMMSAVAVPSLGVEILCKLPDDYFMAMISGDQVNNLNVVGGWYSNGERFNFPATSRYYRMSFGKTIYKNNDCVGEISASEVMGMIATGDIRLSYVERHDIVRDNRESEKYVKAMMREFFTTASRNNTLPNLPVFAHTSDIHGDALRYNRFLEYCDALGVDAALITGDHVALNPDSGYQFINDITDKHHTLVLPCVGNHDVRGLSTAQAQNEGTVGYLITKYGLTVNSQETYPTYFYKDFASKNLRIISLNTHELSRATADGNNFTQAQCDWFIATLASTPQNYGVLVMFHVPEVQISKEAEHDAFYQPFTTYTSFPVGITGTPIRDIIDAFISKTSATIAYTSQGTSISTTADFTGVASGVEFIAYVLGHEHVDWIGLVSGATHRQLALDVTCGVAIYGGGYAYLANIADIPRGGEGPTQDAFNIYAIDRVNKTVRVARVGSNVTPEAKDRKCMIIPYAES
jgi:hypothetical protein